MDVYHHYGTGTVDKSADGAEVQDSALDDLGEMVATKARLTTTSLHSKKNWTALATR